MKNAITLTTKQKNPDEDQPNNLSTQKNNFISNASHEFRTPLGIIRGYAQLTATRLERRVLELKRLADAYPDFSALFDHFDADQDMLQLKAIINQVDKIDGLLTEILDASLFETGETQMSMGFLSLEKLVKEIIIQHQANSINHSLVLHLSNQFPDNPEKLVFGDPQKINQVISNLISNAIKYSPDSKLVEVQIKYDYNGVLVIVSDQGIGIPLEEQTAIFDCYYRATNASQSLFGGLGVGLYLCECIITQHDGYIWVESQLNKGSKFMFWLPTVLLNSTLTTESKD
jgi:signal transduction histidine kinase